MPTTLLLAHPDLKTQRQLCEALAAPSIVKMEKTVAIKAEKRSETFRARRNTNILFHSVIEF